MNCKISEIGTKVNRLMNVALSTLDLINQHFEDNEAKLSAANTILVLCFNLATSRYDSAQGWYKGCSMSVRSKFTDDMLNYCFPCVQMLYKLADKANAIFADKNETLKRNLVAFWKKGLELHLGLDIQLSASSRVKNVSEGYLKKIEVYAPGYRQEFEKKVMNQKLGLIFGGICIGLLVVLGIIVYAATNL